MACEKGLCHPFLFCMPPANIYSFGPLGKRSVSLRRMFFVNFKDKKKVDHIFENSLDVQSFLDALHVPYYQLSELEDDIQVVSRFPCLLGHPVHQRSL